MLYSDQVGLPVIAAKGRAGLSWVRTTTDRQAAVMAMLSGDTVWKGYLRSIKNCTVDAVFCPSDPLPGLAEVALIPYLAIKRGS